MGFPLMPFYRSIRIHKAEILRRQRAGAKYVWSRKSINLRTSLAILCLLEEGLRPTKAAVGKLAEIHPKSLNNDRWSRLLHEAVSECHTVRAVRGGLLLDLLLRDLIRNLLRDPELITLISLFYPHRVSWLMLSSGPSSKTSQCPCSNSFHSYALHLT